MISSLTSLSGLTYLKIGAVVVLFAALTGAKMYYTWSQTEIDILNKNNIKLELAVNVAEQTIKAMKDNIKAVAETHATVSKQFARTRTENNKLKTTLSKHDIRYLAKKKPGLITKIINQGTTNISRCLEIASGAPLRSAEINATLKSEINTACPDISNPNYKEVQ